MKKLFTLILCLLALNSVFGQLSLGHYTFSPSTSGSLDPMVGATSLVGSGGIISGYNDDYNSAAVNIGFTFTFMGTPYTQFSVNSNGQVRLGSAAIDGIKSGPAAGYVLICPFGGDNSAGYTGDADPISYVVTGTAPSRILVVQWKHFNTPYNNNVLGGNMQLWLHEDNGEIDFVYGAMYCNAATTRAIFLGSDATATTAGYITVAATPTFTLSGTATTNSFASGNIANLYSAANGSRVTYSWTPPMAPTAASNLTFVPGQYTMQLSWTDSPNESVYYIQRSTDGVNYTTIATLNQNVVTYTATGLFSSTLYYWKVIAANEFGSTPISGTKSTSEGTICGNFTVGATGANYPTLTAAFADITTNALGCDCKLILQGDYVSTSETFPLQPPSGAAIGSHTLTIYPSVTGLAITSANTTGTINMNGCRNVIFDGRVGGTGSINDLVIANTNLGTSYAIQFINDAASNTVKYCNIRSVNNSTSSGTIVFSTTTGANGNDNNTISNNNIYDGATTPYNAIYALGTTTSTATNNSGINISNNNIYNFFYAGGADYGIYVSSGNTDWTISGNSFYQTATRTYTASANHMGIYISNSSSGNNFSITGNYIGGGAASCGGTAWTFAGAFTNRFRGISMTVGTTTASNVQGNTIANFSHTTNSSATTAGGPWVGIYTTAGNINIGTVTGNTIGSGTGNGSLTLTLVTNSGGLSSGIYLDGGTTLNVSNNTIGSVTIPTSTIGYGFQGIVAYSGTTITLNNNLIGSLTTANSININTGYTGTTAQIFRGIYNNTGSSSTVAITNNTIANINNNYLPATASTSNILGGIIAPLGINTITGNTIRDITTAANATGTTSSASVIGISMTSTTAPAVVSQNTIYGLSNTNSGANAINVTGIYYAGPTSGTNVISRNFIRSLNLSATIATAQLVGINFQSGLANIQNNMVRLGIDQAGNAITNGILIAGINDVSATANSGYYYNSIYIGGNGVATLAGNTYAFQSATTTNARVFKNNVFMNARSNGASTGKHYAIKIAGTAQNPAGLTINNNDYYVSGNGGVFGYFNSLDVATLAAWKTAVGQDAASVSADPHYLLPGGTASTVDLHIDATVPCALEGAGAVIAGVTNDFDNDTRNASTPDIGADEFNGIPAYTCVLPVPGLTVSTANALCYGQSVTLSLQNAVLGSGVTYQWQSSPDGVIAYSNIPGATFTTYSVTPTVSTFYQCVVTCLDGPTTGISTPLQITFASNVLTTTDGNGCGTGTVSLQATNDNGTLKWYAAGNGGAALPGTGSPWTTPTISTTTTYYVAAEVLTSAPATVQIGNGTVQNGTSSYPSPYGQYYGSDHEQYLVLASELTAMNLLPGNFTSLAFSLGAGYTYNALQNFQMNIAATTATALTTSLITTGFTQVVPMATYTPPAVAGWATINFTTPFYWDGVSNIVVDLSFSNCSVCNGTTSCTTSYSSNGSVNQTTTAYASAHSIYYDGNCTVNTFAPSGSLNNYTYLQRPNMQISGIAGSSCNSPRKPVIANVSTAAPLTISGNQQVCNDAVATIAVTSNTADYTSYVWSPVTNLYTDPGCGVGTEYNSSITTATTVYYKSTTVGDHTITLNTSNPSGCLNITSTVVTVLAAPVITASTNNICHSGFANITTSPTTGYGTTTFQWQISSDGTEFSDILDATLIDYTTDELTTHTWYRLNTILDDGITVCNTSNVVSIDVTNPLVETTTPGTRCGVGTVSLEATAATGLNLLWYDSPDNPISIGSGSPWTTPVIPGTTSFYVAAELGTSGPGDVTIGTGASTTTTSGYPSAFGDYWYQSWHQMLYTAAELHAAGLLAGNITAIKYNIAGLPSNTPTNYSISLASTSATSLSTWTTTGLTTCYGPAAPPTLVAGWNTITFTTPFYWDGVSNIIVDKRDRGSDASANATTYYTATTANTVLSAYTTGDNSSFWTSNPTATAMTSRFDIVFTGIAGTSCAGDRVEVVASVNDAPAVTITADNPTPCYGFGTNLTASSDDPDYTYTWSAGTTPSTGTVVAVTPLINTTYTVNAADNGTDTYAGCVASSTITISPIVLTVTGQLNICGGTTSQLTGSGEPALTDPWISASTDVITIDATGLMTGIGTGTSVITYTDINGCQKTVTATVLGAPAATAVSPICLGASSNLNATCAVGAFILWYDAATGGNLIGNSLSGANFPVTPTTAGTHNYYASATNVMPSSSQTFSYTGTIQDFVVPGGVTSMNIITKGAQGGGISYAGGKGAYVEGNIAVTPGSTLKILVGGQGQSFSSANCGGGGGTYVWVDGASDPLIVAGGGGGAGGSYAGVDASITTDGTAGNPAGIGTAGTAGNGASQGGAGWYSDGGNYQTTASGCSWGCGAIQGMAYGGLKPLNGGAGGCSIATTVGNGGFGGGSGAGGNCTSSFGAGGGGGYSGGVGVTGSSAAGGGGGSFNSGTEQVMNAAYQSGNGQVILTWTNLSGCETADRTEVSVVVNPIPTITGILSMCVGGTTQLTGSGTPATTNAWVSSLPAIASVDGSGFVTGNSAGTSVITYTDINGCFITATVTVNGLPGVYSISPSSATICENAIQHLGISGGATPTAATYIFSAANGTYTPLAGGTVVSGVAADQFLSPANPIGFTFNYCGTNYTDFYMSSNGFISFTNTIGYSDGNILSTSTSPVIAPLWDDMDASGSLGTPSYLTTGTAGHRVLTVEWLNWEWYYTANNAVISFQCKLYEYDGHIEFVYRQEANPIVSGSASIGLSGLTSGNFLSLDGSGTAPTASSTVNTTSIATKPANGQTYYFYPPNTPVTWSTPNNDLYSDAGATTLYVPGTQAAEVWAKPSVNTTYTTTSTNAFGCVRTESATISVNAASVAPTSILGTTTVCLGGSTTLTADGGVEGTNAVTNWYKGSCDNPFVQDWNSQPYPTQMTTVNSTTGGILDVTSTDVAPQIQMYSIGSFDPTVYKYIQIRYRVIAGGPSGNISIYFTNTFHVNPDPSQVVSGVINDDGDWHILNLDMSTSPNWTAANGNVTGWRFDWCSAWGPEMQFDYIKLGAGTAVAQGPSIDLTPTATATYYVSRSGFCNTTPCTNVTVTVPGNVGVPVFTLGTASTRCSKAETVDYGATAFDASGIVYTLDAESLTGGNTIDAGTGMVTYTAAWYGTSIITATASGCAGPTVATHTVTIKESPTAVTVTPSTQAMCSTDIQLLSASGGQMSGQLTTIMEENFNGVGDPAGWTKYNTSTNAPLGTWTLEPNGYTYSGQEFHSNDNSQFYLANIDATNGGTQSTILVSAPFSTVGYTAASVSYYQYFFADNQFTGTVDYSLDGTNWVNVKTYTNDIGAPNNFIQDAATLPAGQPTVYVRFDLEGGYGYYWAIDNFKVSGNTPNTPITWTPIAGLYSNSAATTGYVLNTPTYSVYAHPTITTIYTATATALNGCITEGTAELTVTTLPVATFSYAGTPYCSDATDPLPSLDGAAGTFTAGSGLSINGTSGLVSLTGSTAGSYTVTNTIAAFGGCPEVIATNGIVISAAATATISYSSLEFCSSVTSAPVTLSGTGPYTGGTFTSSPAGLSIDGSGTIDPSLSTAGGPYTVTYTIAAHGGCAAVLATAEVMITALPVATFSYTGSPYNPTGTALPTLDGVAGVFSSTPGLVFVSTATGEVDLAASTGGTYTVTNTIAAAGGCAEVIATNTIEIIIPTTKPLSVKVIIEGLYVGGGMMHEALDFDGVENFPMKWGAGIADKVTVTLYDDTYSNIIASYPNVDLNTDGSIAIDVLSTLVDSYYITIFPRNSVPITTALPQSFAGTSITYDFTNAVEKAYGVDAGGVPQKDLLDGYFGMYTGELDHDTYFAIDGSDVSVLNPDIMSGPYGYLETDLNGDGVVDGSDMSIMDANVLFGPLFWNPTIAKKKAIIMNQINHN